ncbi:MAG: hypothetical protein ACRYGK_00440 [Janthinobacterium lividum]
MSKHEIYLGQVLQGLCANPSVFAPNGISGWSLVNCTIEQLVELATQIAHTACAQEPK